MLEQRALYEDRREARGYSCLEAGQLLVLGRVSRQSRQRELTYSIGNPLGHDWTLSPSPNNDNHFISLSIEPTCRRLPFVSKESRASPPQIYILAKQVKYLSATAKDTKFAWTLQYIKRLSTELGVHFVGGMKVDDEEAAKEVKAAHIVNLGRLGKVEFYEQLGRSSVFLGVGKPRISPSPWDALCLGVPVRIRLKSVAELTVSSSTRS